MLFHNIFNKKPPSVRLLLNLMTAFLMLIASIILALTLITYSPEDPWFLYAATPEHLHNLLGKYGAYIAAPMMQMLGYSSYLLVIFLATYMWNIKTRNRAITILRISSLLIALPVFSLFLASISELVIDDGNINIVRNGGVLGYYILTELSFFLSQRDIALYSGLISIPLVIFALRLPIRLCLIYLLLGIVTILRKFYQWYMHRRMVQNLMKSSEADYTTQDEIKDKDILNSTKANTKILEKNKNHTSIPEVSTNISGANQQILPIKSFRSISGNSLKYKLPSNDLLRFIEKQQNTNFVHEEAQAKAEGLKQTLQDFGIRGEITGIHPGPVVTLYELEPAAGTKSSRVIGLADDIARSMLTVAARIAVIPGKNAIGIELPNKVRQIVSMRELVDSSAYGDESLILPLILGKDIGGRTVVADLVRMPHLLIAGTTGSGKSVAINTMILSILYRYTPEECRLVMIDPKMLELSAYDGIPHLLTPVVTDSKKAISVLKWVIREMEARYRAMSVLGVRNILGYNKIITEAKISKQIVTKSIQTGFDASGAPVFESIEIKDELLPYIVVVVDEMADLMLVAGKDIEAYIQRLAQMARAAGIHLIMATQRPSVDVITGVIKANFPTRISFQVTSKIDSRTIIGEMGAEQLLGMGDMLYMMPGGRIERIHGPYVSDSEVENIVSFLRSQGAPQYVQGIDEIDETDSSVRDLYNDRITRDGDDQLYNSALEIVLTEKKASTSYIQRCLKIGYNRAASLIERMEKEGIVSPANHTGKREVLK